jgi:hypothetical protein
MEARKVKVGDLPAFFSSIVNAFQSCFWISASFLEEFLRNHAISMFDISSGSRGCVASGREERYEVGGVTRQQHEC